MGAKYKEYGGGSATGLADNLISFLSQGLNTGTFGAGQAAGGDAVGQSAGIASVLNDILSGGAGKLGGSMNQLIQNDTTNQVNELRARYGAAGGTAYGTGAQYGEGVIRAKQAPALATAVGNLQMGAIQSLMQVMAGLAGKGIAQRQGVMEQNPLVTGLQAGGALVKEGLSAFAKAPGAGGDMVPGGGSPIDMIAQLPGLSGPLPGVQLTPSSNSSYGWTPSLFDYGLKR